MIQLLETLVETEIYCCGPRFPLILTAKFHSLFVKDPGVRVGNLDRSVTDILLLTPQPCLINFTCRSSAGA